MPPSLFDITVDSHDHVYVSDSANNRLYKLTSDGELIVTERWDRRPASLTGRPGWR
ncbi:MAG: hypothetical protein R2854_15365 [Caldilineaceae bacterium]